MKRARGSFLFSDYEGGLMAWILARLREPSTYRGLVWVLTATGISVSPELAEQIMVVGAAIAGLLGVALEDAK